MGLNFFRTLDTERAIYVKDNGANMADLHMDKEGAEYFFSTRVGNAF